MSSVLNKIKLLFRKKMQSKLPYLELHILDHCNLNCAGCDHYCPLVTEEKFIDIEEFTEDIKELSKKIDFKIIRLMGGEPLLHPHVNKFIEVTRKYYPSNDIRIVSNGILIPAMKQDFWDTMKENRIKFDLSKYPPASDNFSKYLDIIAAHNISIGNIHVANEFMATINPKGDSDPIEAYKHCYSRECVNLMNHRVYNCSQCYRGYYNKYFNAHLAEMEGIDIYKNSGRKIKKFLLTIPGNACKYCTVSPYSHSREWRVTSKDKSDWED